MTLFFQIMFVCVYLWPCAFINIFTGLGLKHQYNLTNSGEDCWKTCNYKDGPCDYCGGGLCCRKNWGCGFEKNCGCEDDIGGDGYHTCVLPCKNDVGITNIHLCLHIF